MGAKIKRNDMVEVIAGNDRGKRGKVLRVLRERDRALVERVNVVKRHMKPSAVSQGGILEKEAPVHLSNLALVCEKCDRPVRVGFRVLEDGRKVRACKRCGEVFDK
ncbi:50S ribosomal protein L24 [Deferrisoma palaeochoriense]